MLTYSLVLSCGESKCSDGTISRTRKVMFRVPKKHQDTARIGKSNVV